MFTILSYLPALAQEHLEYSFDDAVIVPLSMWDDDINVQQPESVRGGRSHHSAQAIDENAHERQEYTEEEIREKLSNFYDRCQGKYPDSETLSGSSYSDIFMAKSVYQNCMFGYAWANHVAESDVEDPSTARTEVDFAANVWAAKFGIWWKACYPHAQYAPYWPGVGYETPAPDEEGLARCTVEPVGEVGYDGSRDQVVTGCECYPFPDDYELPQDDIDLVLEGNCPEGDPEGQFCIIGAKKILSEHNWGSTMTWMAILETLDEILEQYTEGIHLSVDDVYYIKKHFPHLLDADCTSCQFYAAVRPMPYIKGVYPDLVREDMVAFGKIREADEYGYYMEF